MLFTQQEPARNVEDQQQEHLQKNLTKLIIIFISIAVVIALVVSVLAIALRNNKNIYSAYLQLINQYETNYGVCTVEQDKLLGFCFAQMVDFDNDQTEELLLCYREPEDQEYQYDIYSFNGRKPKKVYSDVGNSPSDLLQTQHDSLQLVVCGGKIYMLKITVLNDEDGDWERREYIGYVDGQFVVQITLDRHFEKNMYRLNGEYVSKEEYNEHLNKWKPSKTVEFSEENLEQLKKEIDDTKDTLEDLIVKYDSKETLTNAQATEQVVEGEPTADDRFGEVVTDGTSIYYWKYNNESFDGGTELNYDAENSITNQLVCNTNGTETVIAEANGSGNLAIANGRIFFVAWQYEGLISVSISSCRLDGSDAKRHDESVSTNPTIVGVTDDNQWIIYETVTSVFSLSTSNYSTTYLAWGKYLISYENKIYYEPHNSENHAPEDIFGSSASEKRTLCVINPDGTKDKTLYTAPAALNYFGDVSFTYGFYHPYVQDGFFYAAYAIAEYGKAYGPGGRASRIVKVNLETGQGEIVAGQEEEVSEYFVVDEAGNVLYEELDSAKRCLNMNEPKIVGNEVMMYNAQKQQEETIITAADHATLTGKFINSGLDTYEYNIAFDFVEIIGNKVYYTIHTGTHNPEGDDGMFTSYRRDTSALFEKDLTTGKVTELNRF